MLLSIALGPLLADRLWHSRMGLIAAGWSLALLLPWALAFGIGDAAQLAWHAVLLEYLPFVALIFALFTLGGGIVVQGGPWGSPGGNTLLLALGTLLASLMGTTGAAMVLIHPAAAGQRPPHAARFTWWCSSSCWLPMSAAA